jgi:hypothetical protein
MWLNGVLENSGSVAIPSSVDSEDWNIGWEDQAYEGIHYADAVFDDVRIWSIARTQEEIQATMNTTLKGNEPGLVGYWNFDDGTANDLSPNGNHGSLKGDAKIVESDLVIAPIVLMPQSIIPRTVGESFSLGIDAAANASLHNFTFDLTFNPTILQAVKVEPGSFLSNNGKDKIISEIPQIDNAKGRITGISCRREGADGVSGDGEIIKVNFKAISVGESSLQIENASFSSPDGNPIKSGARDGFVIVFPPHGRITGRVIDFQGKPVGGIEVFALKEDVPVGISGKTDGDGNYVIENITEAGEVIVQTRKAGLLPGIATVPVQIRKTTANVDFVLEQPGGRLNSVVDENGFIRNWLLLGPILWENDANRLITDQFVVTDPKKPFQPQEGETKAIQPLAGEYGEGMAKTQQWTLHVDSDGDIDLASLYGEIKGVVYAFTLVKSPKEQEVTLLLGSDDGVIAWLNDKLIHFNGTARGRAADQDAVANLTLNAGWNRLLIKVENQGGAWGFLARFAEGKYLKPITDLDITPQWQSGEIKEFSLGLVVEIAKKKTIFML